MNNKDYILMDLTNKADNRKDNKETEVGFNLGRNFGREDERRRLLDPELNMVDNLFCSWPPHLVLMMGK